MKVEDFITLKNKLGRIPTNEEQRTFEFEKRKQIKKYANMILWTDVHPYEVVKNISSICVEIRPMLTKQIKFPTDFHKGGFVGHYADNRSGQEYEYSSNPEAPTLRIRFSKKGYWSFKGQIFLMSDNPYKFYDYNF